MNAFDSPERTLPSAGPAPVVQDVLTIPRKLPASDKVNIVGLTREQLKDALIQAGTPEKQAKMRVGQVWQWVYHWGVRDFAQMTNLAKDYRAFLAERFEVALPEIVTRQVSEDGTRKYLLRIAGGHEVETVYIPEEGRGTLCVSSQVGCTLTCSFCHTGTQKLVRNLTAGEIVGQLMVARDDLGEWPEPGAPRDETRLVSNLVLMGMGEPLYNFDNVRDAMAVVMDGEGLSLSRRRITLSTSGVVPMMDRCGEELGVNLAVSLHAVRDDLRDEIVPLNRKYPIAELIAACRRYPGASNARRITFEYVMLRGVNDSEAEARRELERVTAMPPVPPKGFDNFDQWLTGTKLERELKLQEYSVSNLGLRPNLVGTPEQLIERISAYEDAGLDLLLLQCSPQAEEMDRFAEQVIAPMKAR